MEKLFLVTTEAQKQSCVGLTRLILTFARTLRGAIGTIDQCTLGQSLEEC